MFHQAIAVTVATWFRECLKENDFRKASRVAEMAISRYFMVCLAVFSMELTSLLAVRKKDALFFALSSGLYLALFS